MRSRKGFTRHTPAALLRSLSFENLLSVVSSGGDKYLRTHDAPTAVVSRRRSGSNTGTIPTRMGAFSRTSNSVLLDKPLLLGFVCLCMCLLSCCGLSLLWYPFRIYFLHNGKSSSSDTMARRMRGESVSAIEITLENNHNNQQQEQNHHEQQHSADELIKLDICATMDNVLTEFPLKSSVFRQVVRCFDQVLVVADLHGDLIKFQRMLRMYGLTDPSTNNWIVYDHIITKSSSISSPSNRSIEMISIPDGWKNTLVVQTGDVVDRGNSSIELVRYMIKLKYQSKMIAQYNSQQSQQEQQERSEKKKKRPSVHLLNILGNHEWMNLEGAYDYVNKEELMQYGGSREWTKLLSLSKQHCSRFITQSPSLLKSADKIRSKWEDVSDAMVSPLKSDASLLKQSDSGILKSDSPVSYLLRNTPVTMIVGNTLFVHAGLRPEVISQFTETLFKDKVLSSEIGIEQALHSLNEVVRAYLHIKCVSETLNDAIAGQLWKFLTEKIKVDTSLTGNEGLFWTRAFEPRIIPEIDSLRYDINEYAMKKTRKSGKGKTNMNNSRRIDNGLLKEWMCVQLETTLNLMNVTRMVIGHNPQFANKPTIYCDNRLFLNDRGLSSVYGGYKGALLIDLHTDRIKPI